MTKHDKEAGVLKPSTAKRIDAAPKPHRKAGRKRKEYPPCWEVRQTGYGYLLFAHRVRPAIPFHWRLDQLDHPDRHDLRAYLAWYAEQFPHTASLPVRFISCQPVECGREVISN